MPKGKPTSWSFRIKVEGKALEALNETSKMLKEQKTKGVKRADIVALFVNAKMTNAATLQALATAVAKEKKEQKTKGVKRADIVALFVNAKMTNAATLQALATAVAKEKKATADAAAKEKKIARLVTALAAARGETPKKKK